MKRTALTKLILASLVTSGLSAAAHADDKATFDAQLTVSSVNKCQFTVTRENGTEMSATYTYTSADQQAGTFGTTVLNTTAPLTVLVSSGDDSCPLGQFTVATSNPGVKIAKNTAGIPTHDGGYWPVRWVYTNFDAYDKADGTQASVDDTLVGAAGDLLAKASFTANAHKSTKVVTSPIMVNNDPYSPGFYGSYNGGLIPGLLSSPGNLTPSLSGNTDYPSEYGTLGVNNKNDNPTLAVPRTITPPATASSLRVGLGMVLATFPYGKTTKAPDPLTVYDTVTGGGAPLSGSGMMTITAL